MDDSPSQPLIRLPRRAVRRFGWRRGDGIAVLQGRVWVTQEGSTADNVLDAGESRAFGRGDLFVQALADAVLIRLRAGDPRAGAPRPPPDDAITAASMPTGR